MKVHVLGTGCAKCNRLYAEAEKAVARLDAPVELEKVERVEEIVKYRVMMTPALVIDGEVRSVGKVPSADQIATWLADARQKG
jgi:small redox-active disulfide protein 2